MLERPAAEWEQALTKAGVGCAAVNMQGHPVMTSFDPVLRETGLTVTFEDPQFGEMVRAAPPVTFSETPGRVALPCMRGEHNVTVLTRAGLLRRGDRAARGHRRDHRAEAGVDQRAVTPKSIGNT